MQRQLESYFSTLAGLPASTQVTDDSNLPMPMPAAFERVIALFGGLAESGGKVMFVGNGGSAGIASHLAIDFLKNGGIPATAFNDGAALTCLGNDLGYDAVFATQISMLGREGDLLIAISSSGRSPNILKAVAAARAKGCAVVSFSGFTPDNPLRGMGDVNFFVPSDRYGFVEIFHMTLIHALLDLAVAMRADEPTHCMAE